VTTQRGYAGGERADEKDDEKTDYRCAMLDHSGAMPKIVRAKDIQLHTTFEHGRGGDVKRAEVLVE
jgi:hypothetical protein